MQYLDSVVLPLLLALSCFAVAECTDCPDVCICYPNHDRETVTVDCRGQELDRIPSPLPNDTSHLDVSNNVIGSIEEGDIWPGASNIRHLQLQNNRLTSIDPFAFSSVPELETLILFNNYLLEDLTPGTLDGLTQLQRLVAYNSGIKKIDPQLFQDLQNIVEIDLSFSQLQCITNGTFQDLPRLKTLSLNNNFITTLEAGSFSNLPSLHYLSLNHNQLQSVPAMAFIGLEGIRTITLTGNPIECGCTAVYLYEFLLREGLSGPTCEGPEQFARRQLLSLEMDEFCALPTAIVVPSGLVVIAASVSPLELRCIASGTPPPSVMWSRDGMTLATDGSDGVVVMETTLIITAPQGGDSGEYHCSASSSAGEVSSSVEVLVLEDTEVSVTEAVVREDVVLDCVSERDLPAGVAVSWVFNGSTLAAVSDQHVVLRNGSLLVLDVWVEEMGNYTCEVGQVQLVRTLTLTARPEITVFTEGRCDEPGLLRIDSDQRMVLRCVAEGIPPPTVLWVFEDRVLNSSQPAPGMMGGAVEVTYELFRPLPMDAGVYMCIAESDVDTVMRNLTVAVREVGPLVSMVLMDLEHLAGETVIFECPVSTLDPEPGFQVTWSRRQGQLPANRVNFTCDNQTLVLRDAQGPEDIDEYICQVEEPSGRIFRLTILLTLFEPATINRACGVPLVIARVGEDVQLSCETMSNPPPVRWVWRRRGMVLVDGEDRITFSNGVSVRVGEFLSISMLQLSDSGIYNCTVTVDNIMARSFSDSTLIELQVVQPPEFLRVPENSSVVTGSSIQLPCSGEGVPPPSLTWWSDIRGVVSQVRTDGQHFVSRDSLLLMATSQLHEGFYYCNLTTMNETVLSDVVFLDVLIPPFFLPFRSSRTLKVGDSDVTLECDGAGDPLPDVQWFRLPDMLPLPSPDSPNIVVNDSNLLILDVSAADGGIYRCTLSSEAGELSMDLTVTVKAPPSPTVEPGDEVTASVGCQLLLTCLDGGLPPGEFFWSFNDLPLQTLPGVLLRDNGELLISDLRVEDSGNYSCTVFGAVGEAMAVAMVIVEDPVFAPGFPSAPPTITSPTPSFQLLSMGQTAQFVCLVSGFPPPEVVWLRDGEPLPNLRRIMILHEALSIRDVRINDIALYECVATNPLGEERQLFQLNVTNQPFIAVHPLPQQLAEGETLRLLCAAGGYPIPTIRWLFNGEQVMEDNRTDVISSGSYSQLRIRDVSLMEDTGVYSCVAENPLSAEHAVTITIVESVLAPMFEMVSRNMEVALGDTVILECIIVADPASNITWLMEGELLPMCSEELPPSMACVVSDVTVVVIQETREESEGQYSCNATNPHGEALYEVTVSLRANTSLPVISVPPLPQLVGNGTEFQLDCVATVNVSWLLNREPVNFTTGGFQQLDNGSLVIATANGDTAGFYTCVADNGLRSSESTVQVNVVPPSFLTATQDENIVEDAVAPVLTLFPLGVLTLFPGHSTVLDCTASGTPTPDITWTRNGLPIPFPFFPSLSLAANGSLLLTAVSGSEGGNYSCKATNQEGIVEAPFQLTINDGIISGTSERGVASVLSGSPVELHCDGVMKSADTAVLWRHGDRVVHESEWMRVRGNGTLLITAARMDHAGLYKCLAAHTGGGGWMENTILLTVKPREEPPSFTVRPEDVHVLKKGFVVLPCTAISMGGEETHIHWRHGNRNIGRTGPRHGVLQDNSLVLTNVRVLDGGLYSCVAGNQHGVSVSTAELTVSRLQVDQFLYEREGSAALLSCGLGGGGGVKWLKDNVEVTPNGEVWLSPVSHTHQGEYTCSYEQQTLNYFLIVHAAPRITTSPTIASVAPGDTAALHCAATGRPHPHVTWSHGGLQLKTDNIHSVLPNGTLLVYDVKEGRDGGAYICTARNMAGVAEISSLLVIII